MSKFKENEKLIQFEVQQHEQQLLNYKKEQELK